MTSNKKFEYLELDIADADRSIKSVELLASCFSDRERYSVKRLSDEIKQTQMPFYRKFIVAEFQGVVVGVGGIKALDWASDTHALYLSSVAPEFRNRGIGRTLVKARLSWLFDNFKSGRVLVSSQKIERFKSFGFKQVSHPSGDGRAIMLKEF
jgi:predicted N-acetyltransferase YhbS